MISDALAHQMAGMGVAPSSSSGEFQQRRLARQFEADYLQLDDGRLIESDAVHEAGDSVLPSSRALSHPLENSAPVSLESAAAVAEVAQLISASASLGRLQTPESASQLKSGAYPIAATTHEVSYRLAPNAGKNSQPLWLDSLAHHRFQTLDKSYLQVIENAGQLHVYLRNYYLKGEQLGEVMQWIESLLQEHPQHIMRVVFNGHIYSINGATMVMERNPIME